MSSNETQVVTTAKIVQALTEWGFDHKVWVKDELCRVYATMKIGKNTKEAGYADVSQDGTVKWGIYSGRDLALKARKMLESAGVAVVRV